jgi:hypothetical protein
MNYRPITQEEHICFRPEMYGYPTEEEIKLILEQSRVNRNRQMPGRPGVDQNPQIVDYRPITHEEHIRLRPEMYGYPTDRRDGSNGSK